jgi:hypothetical protein
MGCRHTGVMNLRSRIGHSNEHGGTGVKRAFLEGLHTVSMSARRALR